MLEGRTYSITELTTLTRFDRRTIVYYIQQGLLPKAGRRGPNTRHSHLCLQRLLFIKGLKDLQDQGRCDTITLRDMGRMLDALSPEELRNLLDRGLPVADVAQLLKPPAVTVPAPTAAPDPAEPVAPRTVGDGRSYGLADAGIRQRQAAPQRAAPAPPAAPAQSDDTQPRLPALAVPGADTPEDLGELLRELEVRPGLSGRRLPPGASEHWTEIPITSRVFLSVRGLAADDAPLADATARALKKLLRTR